MPCQSPLGAGVLPGKTRHGKRRLKIVGKASEQPYPTQLLLRCSQCIGCRLDKSRLWAVRIMHETKSHAKCSFLTLTYDDKSLPSNGSLNKSHLRTFFNDLRGRLSYGGESKIKFFAVGEYGEKSSRPHYHAIVFGQSFRSDCCKYSAVKEAPSRSGGDQFSHGLLSEVWPYGLHRVSKVTFESAAYVARYSLKKITGVDAADHYGERTPEFLSISNGIGKAWFETWKEDVYPSDQIVIPDRGEMMPPPYYDRLLEKVDPVLFARVKERRSEREKQSPEEWRRLLYEKHLSGQVKEVCAREFLKREV